ncbi:MAG: pentapeptide repeat-containing protein [Anaeroplasma sp.]
MDIIKSNQYELSIAKAKEHFNNVDNNSNIVDSSTKDFSEMSIKRTNLKNQKLYCYDFSRAALTGSIFNDVDFIKCNFNGAVAEFCNYYNCSFVNDENIETMSAVNFSNSNCINCKFVNIKMFTSSFTNTYFKNSIFDNCKIILSSLENSIFDNVTFKNTKLTNLNIEFSEFRNIHCDNVVFQISQIAYVFGALQYILGTKDNIWIYSKKSKDEKITVKEFRNIIPDLINYYYSLDEFFPVANLYIAIGEYNKALRAIYSGIDKCAVEKDFRMLKFYCKLIVLNGWSSKKERYSMYKHISTLDQKIVMTDLELHNYYLHFGDFRRILLFNDYSMPSLYYTINSNIDETDFGKLSSAMKYIDNIISNCEDENSTHCIEIRHESPFSFLLVIVATTIVIKNICQIINYFCETTQNIENIITKTQEIKLNKQQMIINNQLIEEGQKKMKEEGIILKGSFYTKNLD